MAERLRFWRAQGADLSEFETREITAAEKALPEAPPKRRPAELSEAEAFAKFPCVHRVPTDRSHVCKPCRGSRTHTICSCRPLGRECTVRASDAKGADGKRVEICLTCELRQPPECPHLSSGCCRLAAVLASAPVNLAPVRATQCVACLQESPAPEIDRPTGVVKALALKAAYQWQPQRAAGVAKTLGVERRAHAGSTASYLRDRDGRPVEIGGLYRGATVFLVCGGPSLNRMDLSGLTSRGVLVAAVNQVAATHVRPQLWFSVDDPAKFHESIWKDPGILCFTKQKYLRHVVWESDGGARKPTRKVCEMPSVVGYAHRCEWPCDFLEGAPTWGKEGIFKSVFIVALRILADLGVKRICLLGADFHMDPAEPYAFNQQKSPSAAESNNRYYDRMNRDLPAVWRSLLSIGCEVVNCTPGSHLDAFPTSTLTAELARMTIAPATSVAGLY
jgi:hypothetical protein